VVYTRTIAAGDDITNVGGNRLRAAFPLVDVAGGIWGRIRAIGDVTGHVIEDGVNTAHGFVSFTDDDLTTHHTVM